MWRNGDQEYTSLSVSKRFFLHAALFALVVLAIAPSPSFGQVSNQLLTSIPQKRVALIIGNADYTALPALRNPINDVTAVADILRKADFDVLVGENLGKLEVEEYVRQFLRSADGADVSLFYYSGHGIGIAGQNYLVPVDADLTTPYDVELQMSNLDTIMNFMRTHSKTQLVFLDACRDNPFPLDEYWKGDRLERPIDTGGLSQMSTSVGSLIAFATAPRSVAYDGEGDKSPFTGSFVQRALTPNLEIRSLLTEVRRDVIAATNGQQVPWENSSLVDNFFFVQRTARPVIEPMLTIRAAADENAVALNIPPPRQPEGGRVSVTLEQLPTNGAVKLQGAPLGPGSQLNADDLTKLVFVPEDDTAGSAALIVYRATNEWQQDVRGVVAITVDRVTGAERELIIAEREQETQRIELALADTASLFRGAMDGREFKLPIGVGPVPLGIGYEGPQDSGGRAWIEVTQLPSGGLLRAGDRALTLGERLQPGDLTSLSYEPQIGTQEQALEAVFTFDGGIGQTPISAAFSLLPQLTECVHLAGEPLDLQGVAPGRLPNEISRQAIEACARAMATYPDVPRFEHQFGRALLANRQVAEANQAFAGAADRGHMRAIYQIGYMHVVGAGFERDRETANTYYRRSSDLGDPYGMTVWGRALYHGRGVEQDTRRGLELLLAAADQGHTYAMNDLGAIFVFGQGIDPDPARGLRFLEAGAERNDIYSINLLGLTYLRGQGIEADPSRAFGYFMAASDGGHPNAPTNIGRMYRDGFGVSANLDQAKRFLEIGAERGDGYGAFDRAVLAMQEGTRDGTVTAARFFAMASALGRVEALIQDGYANLKVIGEGEKQAALRQVQAQLDRSELPVETGDLDEMLVKTIRALWEKNNPRFDLF